MPTVACLSCSSTNDASLRACTSCGASLPELGEVTFTTNPRPPAPAANAPQPTSRLASEKVDLRDVVAWLSCEPLDPVPIVAGARVTVGRNPDCDLVLRDKAVSRLQAVIVAEGKQLRFFDEGSSNGTFLNGKRTAAGPLEPGDVLGFGPYDVHLHSNDSISSRNRELDLEGTQVIEASSITTGFLHEASLAELLQGLEFHEKSGTLKILSGSLRGVLHVQKGRPWRAELGDARDEEAAIRMLSLEEGRYTFTTDVEPGERTMSATITGLLLEASRRQDQGEEPT